MMRQGAVVVVEPGGVQGFHRLRRLLMQDLASLLQHRAVGDFLGQRMLENVLDFGKRGLFVEKLFALERGEQAVQVGFGLSDDLADQTHGKLATNDRELLQQGFLVWQRGGRCGRPARLARWSGICRVVGRGATCRASPPSRPNTPCSYNSCTISSMKNGVPWVLSRMSCLRASVGRRPAA